MITRSQMVTPDTIPNRWGFGTRSPSGLGGLDVDWAGGDCQIVPMNAAFGSGKIFCMVRGKGFATLKRHLTVSHDLTAKEYRKQFGIPAGTVLAARDYSESRRKMAKDMNLADGLAKARAAKGKK